MPDFAVVLSLPTESVAIRAAVGSVVGLALVALLLRRSLRAPRVRFFAALVPILALVGAALASLNDPLLPWISVPSEADNVLKIFHSGSFLDFRPLGWVLFAVWVAVAALRVARRVAVLRRMSHVASAAASPRDLRVAPIVRSVARELRVDAPRVLVVDGCPGGALVVGVRDPRIVVDAELLATLDTEELEGMLAHEVAHIRRRDNLVALVVGLIRDVCFFIPGGRWVARRLCSERELAADQAASQATGRPGALASGLLKVLDRQRPQAACAAFAAPSAVVSRVERLIENPATPGPWRGVGESAAVAGALTLAVAAATYLPGALAQQTNAAGNAYEGLAVAFIPTDAEIDAATAEPVAFEVFRAGDPAQPLASGGEGSHQAPGQEFHPSYLSGDRAIVRNTIPPAVPTTNRVRTQVAHELVERWSATPFVEAEAGLAVFLLHRLELDAAG